jgi:hypothetical protein
MSLQEEPTPALARAGAPVGANWQAWSNLKTLTPLKSRVQQGSLRQQQ